MRKARAIAFVAGGMAGLVAAHFFIRSAASKREQKLQQTKAETALEIRALWMAYLETIEKVRGGKYSEEELEQAMTDFEFTRLALRNPDMQVGE